MPASHREIAIVQRGIAQLAIQGDTTAKFDPLKLNWLGSLSSFANDAYVLIVNARHPAKTVWDLAPPAPPALIGGDAPGSTNLTFALIAKHALKLNIEVKDGFSGAAGMFFAMNDGDLDGQVIGLNSLMANQPELWRTKDVRPLLQFGRRTRHPLLPDVPLASEYTTRPRCAAPGRICGGAARDGAAFRGAGRGAAGAGGTARARLSGHDAGSAIFSPMRPKRNWTSRPSMPMASGGSSPQWRARQKN